MKLRHAAFALAAALAVTGCGTRVPEIRDFPNNQNEAQNDALVHAIIVSIHCELEDAVTDVINERDFNKKSAEAYDKFLKTWGAQVALTLRLDEQTSVSPSGLFGLPHAAFSLVGGPSGTADATRVDIINFQYKVSELYLGDRKCERDTVAPTDSLLIQSDLKLREWLDVMFLAVATGQIVALNNKNVLSHQVTFDVTTSADITPAWKLANGAINQRGLFLKVSRDRKHDLLVTFGPLDKTNSGSFLVPIAETTHELSQLTSGVATGFQNSVRP
jgi:hypothetical protein